MPSTNAGGGVQLNPSHSTPHPQLQSTLLQPAPQSRTPQVTPQPTPQPTPQSRPNQPTPPLSPGAQPTPSVGTSTVAIVSVPQNNPGNSSRAQNPHGTTRNAQLFRSFLRSVGLKVLTSIRYSGPGKADKPKVIVSQSLRIALTRAGVHIFPITITCFLLLLNGVVLLNGPDVTTNTLFGLQVVAKLHVSSLT